uniref:cytochrome P450 2J5-like n=1 Tax=Euleptes europaea TaxID=460621 RepID=UPI0025419F6D|nr:cytochrome P450 2J5-like [Euleptes europaea]
MQAGHTPIIVLNGFQAVKEGLITCEGLSERAITPLFEDLIKNRGVIFSNGHVWKQQRRFGLTTMRKLGMGKSMAELWVQEQASQLVEYFALQKGRPVDPWECLLHSVSSVICKAVLGHNFSFGDKKIPEIYHSMDDIIQYVAHPLHFLYFVPPKWMSRIIGPPRKLFNAFQAAIAFAKEEIRNHEKKGRSDDPQDFIDFYLNQMDKSKDDPTSTYNEGNLTISITDLIGSGVDTTAISLYWTLLYMAAYPNIQANIQKELDDVLGPSHVICYDDRKKLPYTNAVIHEVLRFSSIISSTFRQCTKDMVVQGFLIKKGTIVSVNLRTAMFDPEYWETPDQFNPNHFLDEDGNFSCREAFISFSAGHRVCMGEQLARVELFIIVSSLFQAFTFRAPEGVQEMNLNREMGFIVRPHRYTICATPR